MEILLFILGFVFAITSGILFMVSLYKDDFLLFVSILVFCLAFFCLAWSNSIAEKSNKYTIEALNGTLQYDTVSLDKNGKLLEIKIK